MYCQEATVNTNGHLASMLGAGDAVNASSPAFAAPNVKAGPPSGAAPERSDGVAPGGRVGPLVGPGSSQNSVPQFILG